MPLCGKDRACGRQAVAR